MAPFKELHKPAKRSHLDGLTIKTRILTQISINGQYLANGDTLRDRHKENVHHKLIGSL